MTNQLFESDKREGALMGTLHFVKVLTMDSIGIHGLKGARKTPKIVGAALKTDVDIEVPVIHCLKNAKTGFTASDVTSRTISAEEIFFVNLYEAMLLLSRPEYRRYLSFKGDNKGVQLKARTKEFLDGRFKAPSPYLSFTSKKTSILDYSEVIDVQKEDGLWTVQPQYSAFLEMIPYKKSGIGVVEKFEGIPNSFYTCLAVQAIMDKELGYKK